MFRCDDCGNVTLPGVPAAERVVAWRTKRYPARHGAHPHAKGEQSKHDPGGEGRERARVLRVCPECAVLSKGHVYAQLLGAGALNVAPAIDHPG